MSNGSSVDKPIFNPRRKKEGNGLESYSVNNYKTHIYSNVNIYEHTILLDNGDIDIGICFR